MRGFGLVTVLCMLAACQAGGELGPAPAAPTPNVVIGDSSVRVSWEPVPGAARYQLYWLDAPSSTKTVTPPAQEVSSPVVLDGLQNGRTYYLALTALGGGGESGYSDVISVMPRPAPSAPKEIAITSDAGAVALSWPSVATADAYKIYMVRSADVVNDSVASAPALLGVRETNNTAYTEQNLINGIEYSFVVTAVNSSGESVASSVIRATPGPYKSLTAGGAHTCAVDVLGEMWCWGSNNAGQLQGVVRGEVALAPVRAGAERKWKQVAAGIEHSCGIERDEALSCWGNRMEGVSLLALPVRTAIIPIEEQWTNLTSNQDRGCAIRGDGTLWCWSVGALNGRPNFPMTVVDLGTDWLDVTTGSMATYARKQDGSLWVISHNPSYLGVPRRNGVAGAWRKISSFGGNSLETPVCALDAEGRAWCGRSGIGSDRGQLGRGALVEGDAELAPVAGDATWTDIAVGASHACGIQTDYSLWCWGANDYGQLGNGIRDDQFVPLRSGADSAWTRVVAGTRHTCAMRQDGTIWCVGRNDVGQLGAGSNLHVAEPTHVLSDVVAAAADSNVSCAILKNAQTWCWGELAYDEGYAEPRWVGSNLPYARARAPILIDDERKFTRLMPINEFMCGVAEDGALWCWGKPVGVANADFIAPRRVADPASWDRAVVAGGTACTIRTDQTIWCSNEVFIGAPLVATPRWTQVLAGATPWIQLAKGRDHVCALNAANELWCWGKNYSGQLGVPDVEQLTTPRLIRSARSVAANIDQTCAVALEGTLWCWGADPNSSIPSSPVALQIGSDADWITVSLDFGHICATKSDGAMWCGGRVHDLSAAGSPYLKLEPLSELRRNDASLAWRQVVFGTNHSCALDVSGGLYCWGRNDVGQVGDGRAWFTEWQPVTFEN